MSSGITRCRRRMSVGTVTKTATLHVRALANSAAKKAISFIREARKSREMTATLEQQIRQRAYRLFEDRGCEDGHAVEDWLRAEREIRGFASRRGKMEAPLCQSDASQSRILPFEIDGAPPREITKH
jgi:hypothetical protein